jgi:hypothetical protein
VGLEERLTILLDLHVTVLRVVILEETIPRPSIARSFLDNVAHVFKLWNDVQKIKVSPQ